MFWQAPQPKRNAQRPVWRQSGGLGRPELPAPWRARLRRALDLAVAFATLEDAPPPPGHPDAPGPLHDHPHRRTLPSPQHRRRPGTVAARVTPCTTPLAPSAPRRRGRSREWDAQHIGH